MYSRFAYWLSVTMIVLTACCFYPKWQKTATEATISWDVSGYYLYLPAALIYGDLKQAAFFDKIEEEYNPGPGMGQRVKQPNGNVVMKYSSGQALQFLPWFAMAHWVAPKLGYPADGFSWPYQVAISWGSFLIAALGLWFLRRILLFYFSDGAVAATLIAVTFGTNYLNYTAIDGAMTHNWVFTLYALLTYSTIRYYRKPGWGWAALIGLWVGWATLTRPTEAISVLIPLLWGLQGLRYWRVQLGFLWKHKMHLLLAGAIAATVVGIQLGYWKWASGHWLVYSYEEQGFSWLKPHISDVLFSTKAGWLIYSPMMALAFVGFWWLLRQRPTIFWPVLLFCGVFLYVTSAWDIWWYGGSLGQRAMVQSYPLWAFALAAFFQQMTRSGWSYWIWLPVAGLCVYLSLWWTYQAHEGGLFYPEQMTKRFMLKTVGRYKLERDWLKYLDTKDEFKGKERLDLQTVVKKDFEQDSSAAVVRENAITGARSLRLNREQQFGEVFNEKRGTASWDDSRRWIRATCTFRCEPKEWDFWKMTQFIVRFTEGDKIVKERMIRLQRHVDGNEVKTIFFDTKLPDKPYDQMKIFFWNADGEKTVFIDDVLIETFN